MRLGNIRRSVSRVTSLRLRGRMAAALAWIGFAMRPDAAMGQQIQT
jgi:hypothetical protein